MKRKYHVTFYFDNGEGKTGIGSCGVATKRKIRRMEDVQSVADLLKDKNLGGKGTIVILNWREMK